MEFLRPARLHDALALLGDRAPGARPLAGGTDLLVRMKEDLERPEVLVSLADLEELRGIREVDGEIVIGAAVSHEELSRSRLLRRLAPVLAEGAADVGSIQIRHRGTLGGNLANASPSADAVPPLHVLEAQVEIRSRAGHRTLPVAALAAGPKRTVLRPDELIVAVRFPRPEPGEFQCWFKVGQRLALACAKLSLAVRAGREGRVLRGVRVALGGVAPTVVRAPRAEAALEGREPGAEAAVAAGAALADDIAPIDDVRSEGRYRAETAAALLRRAVLRASG